jgi:hypothetical protein
LGFDTLLVVIFMIGFGMDCLEASRSGLLYRGMLEYCPEFGVFRITLNTGKCDLEYVLVDDCGLDDRLRGLLGVLCAGDDALRLFSLRMIYLLFLGVKRGMGSSCNPFVCCVAFNANSLRARLGRHFRVVEFDCT